MSSTRKAADDSVFHQNRYASDPNFERGLIANLVARRCSVLSDAADRELIWFVQQLSHEVGGLAAVARQLLSLFDYQIGTPTMLKCGLRDSQKFPLAEMRQIRLELPAEVRPRFPLKGELKSEIRALQTRVDSAASSAEKARALRVYADIAFDDMVSFEEIVTGEHKKKGELDCTEAAKHPDSYSASTLRKLCRFVAAEGLELSSSKIPSLEHQLAEMCLNPQWDFSTGGPWYFAGLIVALRQYQSQWIAGKNKIVTTTLGKKVCDALDYCAASRSLVLLEGNARLGKSFAARAWCFGNPGKSRFVEVPPGNDEASFFRALARGLGLGNFLNYKVVEIRERVESVLREGDIILVLDEAQRLWPQRNLRYGFPSRVIWVMTMANLGVPIFMISTPQFVVAQKEMEKTGWNSAQLTGRIGHYEFLPTELTLDDLTAVGRAVLPEASADVLLALASYARVSARYLAAVDSIAKRAQFISSRAGRNQCTAEDVRIAMQESVIPSDTMLVRTLERVKNSSKKGRSLMPMMPTPREIESLAQPRDPQPDQAISANFNRRNNSMELIQA